MVPRYVFQEETGENGTKHLQGYFEFSTKVRPKGKIDIKEMHWEKTKNVQASIEYCQKDDTRTGEIFKRGIREKRVDNRFDGAVLRGWQVNLVRRLEAEPDDRKIIWYVDVEGNKGKSWFAKWAERNLQECKVITCTKSADILMSADEYTRTYIFDFPRCLGDFCPWSALEQMKNGLITDAKLKKEARVVDFAPPHIVIFSNSYPDRSKLSGDRWEVVEIE